MASLKAKLKRTLEPQDPLVYGVGDYWRTDTLLDFTEPINGWIMTNAVILVDFTVMAFMEGNISGSGAVRCSHTIILEGPGDGYDGYISAASSATSIELDNYACRYWPSCAVNWLMIHPHLTAFGTIQGDSLYPGSGRLQIDPFGDRPSKPQLLQITYGAGEVRGPDPFPDPWPPGLHLPIRFYISADIMIFDSDEV